MEPNRPANSLAWSVEPSEINAGWSAVGYTMRGPHHGTFVPIHHWHDRDAAGAHMLYLNRGLPRHEAHRLVMALIYLGVPE